MKHPATAERLRQAIERAGIIPAELSVKSGVSQASISQYLSGSHAPSNISSGKMAAVLRCSPVWLMGFDVPRELPSPISTAISTEPLPTPSPTEATTHPGMKLVELDSLENELVYKYRALDDRGKNNVWHTVDYEYAQRKLGISTAEMAE